MSAQLQLAAAIPFASQLINLCAAIMLLLGFAMLAQRRVLTLINLFMVQGLTLCTSTLIVALTTQQSHLLWSAALTLLLKVIALPYVLHRLIRRLSVKWDIETLLNIPTIMLIGIVLVVIAFNVAQPISQLSGTIMRATIGIALALPVRIDLDFDTAFRCGRQTGRPGKQPGQRMSSTADFDLTAVPSMPRTRMQGLDRWRQVVEGIAQHALEQRRVHACIHTTVAMRPVRPLPSEVLRRCEKNRCGSERVQRPPPCTRSMPIAARRWRASAYRSTRQCPGRVATKAEAACASCSTNALKTSSPIS